MTAVDGSAIKQLARKRLGRRRPRRRGVTGQPLPRDLRKSLKQRSTLLHLFFANRGEEKIVQIRMEQRKSTG
jgi:hypothetical protein